MYVLAHLGIGSFIAKPFSRGFPKKYLYLGTLLPDLLDKPIYYFLREFEPHSYLITEVVRGTRGFGHTLLFLLSGLLFSYLLRSQKALLVMMGVATHLLLDQVGDIIVPYSARLAMQPFSSVLFWPLEGMGFPRFPFAGVADHLEKVFDPIHFTTEFFGGLLLVWEYRRFIRLEKVLRPKKN